MKTIDPYEVDVTSYQYMVVRQMGVSPSGKTAIYEVRDRHAGLLGNVKWMGRWRQYAFFPEPNCVFSEDCLYDISRFILRLKSARKKQA
jgi:hypothetical protein